MTQLLNVADADRRLLRELFLNRLSINLHMVLASTAHKDLSHLIKHTDLRTENCFAELQAYDHSPLPHSPWWFCQRALGHAREDIPPQRYHPIDARLQNTREHWRSAAQWRTCSDKKHANAARKCIHPREYAGIERGRGQL
ncbi:hypothetical protein HPB50_018899 [Hyalomma asiaticum]|uniref:Uncharacterized protein n=1 Tax=Hyalomma asiaticum TaxID=266040 RepID=A0ACB7S027_HYAAI|nr:hypothetical protein HPB50_018899 [Hyalomma asiaticum]